MHCSRLGTEFGAGGASDRCPGQLGGRRDLAGVDGLRAAPARPVALVIAFVLGLNAGDGWRLPSGALAIRSGHHVAQPGLGGPLASACWCWCSSTLGGGPAGLFTSPGFVVSWIPLFLFVIWSGCRWTTTCSSRPESREGVSVG